MSKTLNIRVSEHVKDDEGAFSHTTTVLEISVDDVRDVPQLLALVLAAANPYVGATTTRAYNHPVGEKD